jgi:chemotaxis response regulator CheB
MLAATDRPAVAAPPIKVMIVGDSAGACGMMQRWLAAETDIDIIGVAFEVYGAASLPVVLPGMGADGKNGAEAIVAKGGAMIAQDEATSIVLGMPGAVAHVASSIKPLDEIAQTTIAFSQGKK